MGFRSATHGGAFLLLLLSAASATPSEVPSISDFERICLETSAHYSDAASIAQTNGMAEIEDRNRDKALKIIRPRLRKALRISRIETIKFEGYYNEETMVIVASMMGLAKSAQVTINHCALIDRDTTERWTIAHATESIGKALFRGYGVSEPTRKKLFLSHGTVEWEWGDPIVQETRTKENLVYFDYHRRDDVVFSTFAFTIVRANS